MDLATIVGFLGVFGFVVFGILVGGELSYFIDPPSVLITVGGTIMATVMNFPLSALKELPKVTVKAFRSNQQDPASLIQALVGFAVRARREGLLALESETAAASDPFLKKGLGLVVDAVDPEMVRSILETDLAALEERHKVGISMYETMATFGPAFGLIGTLIGLVIMLQNLSDPSTIGPAMAVALLTTFYGSVIASMICTPIAGKLKVRSQEEVLVKELMIEGILAIQAGEGPSVITEKLNSFLSPKQRGGKKTAAREE